MDIYQAKGYIFESAILKLLKISGYLKVENKRVKGRGADHQIDAYGLLSFPTPFIYPIRLLAEAKCHTHNIGLEVIRNYVGVIKDVSENYIIGTRGGRNTYNRHTDAGCIFSATSFSLEAQNYAWAHNIFLISFSGINRMKDIIVEIEDFTKNYDTTKLENIKKKEIIKEFLKNKGKTVKKKSPELLIGILDNIYPVVLVGETGWLEKIDEKIHDEHDKIEAVKIKRESNQYDTVFALDVEGKEVEFIISNIIAEKIVKRIKRRPNEKIFELDIPIIKKVSNNEVRRIAKIDIFLSEEDRARYLENIKNTEI